LFSEILGPTAYDAEALKEALLEAASTEDAMFIEADDFGQRYTLDFQMQGHEGSAAVRSLWIVRRGEDYPRLITCYVL